MYDWYVEARILVDVCWYLLLAGKDTDRCILILGTIMARIPRGYLLTLLRTSVCLKPTNVRLLPALISGFYPHRFEDGDL